MKNIKRRNTINLLKRGGFLPAFTLLAVLLLVNGCDSPGSVLTEGNNTSDTEQPEGAILSPDIVFQVSYDQKTMTFRPFWPGDMVAGSAKGKSRSGDSERMIDYENVHEVTAYDLDGYMQMSREYLEGNADLTMPEDLYEDVKDEMPAPESGYDPVVRSELSNGTLTYYSRSGEVAYQFGVNEEELRIAPATLDSLRQASQNTSGTENKAAQNLAALEKQNVSFKKLDDRHILLERKAKPGVDDEGVAGFKEVLDLSINRAVRSAVLREDGTYQSLTLMNYQKVSGYPVMANSETLHFGMVNGEWGVKERTVRNRNNIEVHFNNK